MQQQLEEILSTAVPDEFRPDLSIAQLASFIARYCKTSPTSWVRGGFETVVVSKHATHIKAKSLKGRNVVLNLGGLLDVVSQGAFLVASLVSHPWLAPFGMLRLWKSLIDVATVEISPVESIVLMALWKGKDNSGCSDWDRLGQEVEPLSTQMLAMKLDEATLNRAIDTLKQLHCIKELPDAKRFILSEKLVVSEA
jgi:hypothetical protein